MIFEYRYYYYNYYQDTHKAEEDLLRSVNFQTDFQDSLDGNQFQFRCLG